MSKTFSLSSVVRRGVTAVVVAGAGLGVASAQTSAGAAQPALPAQQANTRPINFFETSSVPSLTTGLQDSALSSSSSSSNDGYDPESAAQTQMASLGKVFEMPGAHAMQYGQRRRYGAPRYRGGNTNADGSEKYTAYIGGGFNSPVGDNSNYLTTSWGVQGGVGRNFNRHFGVNLEFDFDKFGVTNDTVLYYSNLFADPSNTYGFGANSHIWNFSIQPVYQIYSGQGLGAYLTGGVGFYHKVTNFTLPQEGSYCDYYGFCYQYVANQNFDHYTSNAPGFNGGIGLTYKFSRFANERFYAEARYVYVDNSYKPGITASNADTYTGYNLFPQNSNTTSYFPIKFGIRF